MRTCCTTSWLPLSSSRLPIMTLKGWYKISAAKFRTSRGQVAVKNNVCRCLGNLAMILRICGSKPMSSIRSASSKTKVLTASRATCPPSRKSFKRPGQATMRCTPSLYLNIWSRFGAPPYMDTARIPMHLPKRFASSSVCCANSRVGDITNIPGPWRSGRQPFLCMDEKAGNRNAKVFPLPVAAMPMTSFPCSANGQVKAWICDGPGNPAFLNSSMISLGNSLTSSKEFIFCGVIRRSSEPLTVMS
mmetsp:Transcript_65924/g.129703  ORF Transcript_65924/g.129703 Transcript_65924/m.129703 type:complete len:246 (-) Transcript_65924:132-869(-)